jgi:hypothetical protein
MLHIPQGGLLACSLFDVLGGCGFSLVMFCYCKLLFVCIQAVYFVGSISSVPL